MKNKKILSVILSFVVLLSVIPTAVSAEELTPEEIAERTEKSTRTVYLHAQGENPTVTPNVSTVYRGDTAKIYFAVDNPNKGDFDDSAVTRNYDERHEEPQYDLNGYTVKIYFDSDFFELVTDYRDEDGKKKPYPLDYTVPDSNLEDLAAGTDDETGDDETGSGETGDGSTGDGETDEDDKGVDTEIVGSGNDKTEVPNTPQKPGYFPYRHGVKQDATTINGKTYDAAYATIFFSGSWLPDEKEEQTDDEGNILPQWYNLCMLPLNPLKTGNTEVFIDVETADDYTLELFAKNVSDEFSPTFLIDTINGGRHQIIIKDKLKPNPPTSTPVAGTYTEAQSVTLKAEDGCEIWYDRNDGKGFQKYNGELLDIKVTTEITCYAKRVSDSKESNQVTYTYQIVPKTPLLYDDTMQVKIPNTDSKYSEFKVYATNKDPYGSINESEELYYTFSDAVFDETASYGYDPKSAETTWVKITKPNPVIDIKKSRTVRLIAQNTSGEISDIAVYHLSIKPDIVTPKEGQESGVYTEKLDLELETTTVGAEIYYTTDGSDPRTSGILFDPEVPIPLYKDTTVRAVAKFDGEFGDVSSYYYIFDIDDNDVIDAFYPSGVYEGSVKVTLTPANPENDIKYSVDGGNTWNDYNEVLIINKDTEVLAKTVDKNGEEGSVYTFTYKIKPLPPVFAPETTQFVNTDTVTIYAPESTNETTRDFDLYYTLDGSDPSDPTNTKRIKANEESDSADINISEYTVISAVVLKNGVSYSNVVTHSYDIVTKKPVKPITTLVPGNYTLEIGSTEGYSTQFLPVPEGTKIYYTIGHDGTYIPDPLITEENLYVTEGEGAYPFIDITGNTVIKAVAVNIFGVKSDIGIFQYTITPEAPVAAPSATISGNTLPVVPVSALEGSNVSYTVGVGDDKVTNLIEDAPESFYIDMSTGNAYSGKECLPEQLLGNDVGTTVDSPAILNIWAEMDDVESEPNTYIYNTTGTDDGTLAPPFPDKYTGVYEEIVVDRSDNTFLKIKLYSLNTGDTIKYMLNNDGNWRSYTDGDEIKLGGDTVLQLRAEKGEEHSTVVSYVYNFVPLPPIITLPSGRYAYPSEAYPDGNPPKTKLQLDSRAPLDENPDNLGHQVLIDGEYKDYYEIYYRKNGDPNDEPYLSFGERDLEIDHTMSFAAYVYNNITKQISKKAVHSYIIESDSAVGGMVYVATPFDVTRISADVLNTGDYAKGIKLLTTNKDAQIQYYYSYTTTSGQTATTNPIIYDNAAPIFVNNHMENITINAKLLDKDGNEIAGSEREFKIDFIHLSVPVTSLYASAPEKIEYEKNTKYSLINEYYDYTSGDGDATKLIYYTTDSSDPRSSENRKLYAGEQLTITDETTVKAVYYSTCDGNSPTCSYCREGDTENCANGVYGKVGTYSYTVPTIKNVGGGGGGGGTVTIDKTRKYTKDYFGNEHPTHISYINGYPDGTVQADGHITREEMAAILYRVHPKAYEAPFTTTGEVFPDVAKERWSATNIEYMAGEEIIIGYPDGEFKPSNNLTRAEFAALICRFTKLPEPTKENIFPDLESSHWAYDEILSLYSAGFINGYEDGTVRPENQITRAEVMKVMNIILGRKPLESYVKSLKLNPFTDLLIDKWYYVDVLEATITHNYYLDDKSGYENKWEDLK